MNKLLKGMMTLGMVLALATPILAKDQSPVYGGWVKEECTIETEDGQTKKGYAYLDKAENIETAVPDTMDIVRKTFIMTNRVLTGEEVTQEEVEASRIHSIITTFLEYGVGVKDAVKDDSGKVTIKASGGETVDAGTLVFATPLQDLVVVDDNHEAVRRRITVTFEATGMTKDSGTPYLLHYSVENRMLELLTPDSVDYSGPTPAITVSFTNLSPVAVVYVPTGAVNKPAVDTDTNGVLEEAQSNTWMIFVGAAAVVCAAGAVILKRRNQE